jgi:hypothetical protein
VDPVGVGLRGFKFHPKNRELSMVTKDSLKHGLRVEKRLKSLQGDIE